MTRLLRKISGRPPKPPADIDAWFDFAMAEIAEQKARNDRLERRLIELAADKRSSPPAGFAEVKKGDWRVRAPAGIAVTIAALIAVSIFAHELKALWGMLKP